MSPLSTLTALAGMLALAGSVGQARVPQKTAARDLVQAIRLEVERTLPAHLAVVSVVPSDNLRLSGRAEMTIDWRSPPRRGPATVAVTVRTARRPDQQGWARVELAEVRTLPVLRMPLPSGHRLERDDLEMGRAPAGQQTLTTIEALIGATLIEDLPSGSTVARQQITPAPPVARGSALRVQVRRGSVVLTTSGVLERDVRVGELGSARLEGNGQRIVGRLIDAGTLIVGDES